MTLALDLARQHLRPGETVLWHARPSLIGLVPLVGSALLGLIGLLVSAHLGIEEPGALVRGTPALALGLLGVAAGAARQFVRLRFTTYFVTEERFYAITSFLETHARSIPVSRATAVSVRQGAIGRMLGLWHARIATYGEEGRALDIPAIRDGEGLLREASAAMRRGANVAWLRRGD